MAFAKVGGKRFIFLFGGTIAQGRNERTSSDLYSIDLDSLVWEKMDIQDGPIVGRIQSSLIVVDNFLYIFGGKPRHDISKRSAIPPLASYSIAEYMPATKIWRWVVRDQAYPENVPAIVEGNAISVYDGKKILLTSGRPGEKEVCLTVILVEL